MLQLSGRVMRRFHAAERAVRNSVYGHDLSPFFAYNQLFDQPMRIMHIILSRGFAGSERYVAELASIQSAENDVRLVVRKGHRSRFGTSILDAVSNRVQVSPVSAWWRTQRSV